MTSIFRDSEYNSLDPTSRYILQLAAVIGPNLSPYQLRTNLLELQWPEADKVKALSYAAFEKKFKTLYSRKFIESTRYSHQVLINPAYLELAFQEAVQNGMLAPIGKIREKRFAYQHHFATDFRFAFYSGDVQSFRKVLSRNDFEPTRLMDPFGPEIYHQLDPIMRQLFLADAISQIIDLKISQKKLISLFDETAETVTQPEPEFLSAWLDLSIARGDLKSLDRINQLTSGKFVEIEACKAMLSGDFSGACRLFDTIIWNGKKSMLNSFGVFPGLFYLSLLFWDGSDGTVEKARKLFKVLEKFWSTRNPEILRTIDLAIRYQELPSAPIQFGKTIQAAGETGISLLWANYFSEWLLVKEDRPQLHSNLKTSTENYRKLGFDWLAGEFAGLIDAAENRSLNSRSSSSAHHQTAGLHTLINLINPKPAWLMALNAIGNIQRTDTSKPVPTELDERLVWEWNAKDSQTHIAMDVYHQKRQGAKWTKGRKIALSRLFQQANSAEFKFLTEKDRELISSLRLFRDLNYYGYEDTVCQFNVLLAAKAMIGHPRIVSPTDRQTPYEIVEQAPKLVVTQGKQKQIEIRLDPAPPKNSDVPFLCTMDGPRRALFTFFDQSQIEIHTLLNGTLKVPQTETREVFSALSKVAALIPVHSEIEDLSGPDATTSNGRKEKGQGKGKLIDDPHESSTLSSILHAERVASSSRLHVHLLPFQEGLSIEFFVRPFGDEGPFCPVGEGAATLMANVGGKPLSTSRDLKQEQIQLEQLLQLCPAIAARLEDGTTLGLPTCEEALEALLELDEPTTQNQIVLHWPKGRSLNIAGRASISQFNIQIRQDREWFAASAKLKVDNSLSLDLMQLLDLASARPGKFIQLDDGRFVALTQQLRQRIDELAAYGRRTSGKKDLRFARVHAPVLEEICESVPLKSDQHWEQWTRRMRDAATVSPEVPPTLQTELRDYQQQGFHWMARLAEWGVGACLADDMGLGKTIQAIALLLHRSSKGPALVVAPTSVAANWLSELGRFAPTLNARVFGEGDRDACLETLGPRDVVICSYGLLHTESKRLQACEWHTLILDEAQAIKNMTTQRSQAAMGLNADYRLILTGTPMENHLSELWNLMEFINPGLLGSHDDFQQRFTTPIEVRNCRETKRRLKKLIQPFILRRTKSQVLQELPSRTEVTLKVELSREEASLYESLRQRAIEKLAEVEDQKGKHLQILAEIMRLRRACCHPRLALEGCPIPGSKLDLFSRTIDELLANHHKVLVFSQFVDHLSILREELDRKKVSYQYLDGSTPAKQRKTAVDAFQSGQGDVFLISLKAGGLGLNLTAADYVMHMDPWWNPAVEDQASDRAHRMGQLRPVTIYRFIAEGTIEEKISALHARKRDLADSLLEGSDLSAKLSADELLKLIRE